MRDGHAATRQAALEGNGNADGRRKLGVFLAILDFPVLVAGYRAVIDATPDLRVVGTVACRERLREQVAASAADVVVAECLPSMSRGCTTFDAVAEIRAARPAALILALDVRGGGEQYSLAIRAGAHGFLARDAAAEEVLAAIRGISRGETFLSSFIVTRMVGTYVLRDTREVADDAFETLSERCREVLRLAAIGHTNREIARELKLPEQTIRNHRAAVMEKLRLHDRVELLRYALRRGLVREADL